ncbi:hypothetical protein [Curtobacterium citreum]|uniref:hypothetical protein n=1 Tax=Curtobacterium citreum TaxID=2036 RepID=UPI002543A4C2|nr:hypothetical protein [Curtobacterium citreum]WIJ45788.1 hypothetical protein QPK07_02135 [Curtobacterium citreum]
MTELPTCWWCGSTADSREHKFKASELRASHGPEWRGEAAVVHGSFGGQQQEVRGSKADELKWPPSKCKDCNNRRSQPFDRAYDQFLRFLELNETAVLARGGLSFRDVFGKEWRAGRSNLVKYWVKHVCCRAVEVVLPVPPATCAYLDSPSSSGAPPHIRMRLMINEAVIDIAGTDSLHVGSYFTDALGWSDPGSGELIGFDAAVGWGWLALVYEFRIPDPSGATTSPRARLHLR